MKSFTIQMYALFFLSVSLFELIDPSGSIHEHVLTSEKWMRFMRDFKFIQWIFVSVLPFNRFFSLYGRTG